MLFTFSSVLMMLMMVMMYMDYMKLQSVHCLLLLFFLKLRGIHECRHITTATTTGVVSLDISGNLFESFKKFFKIFFLLYTFKYYHMFLSAALQSDAVK